MKQLIKEFNEVYPAYQCSDVTDCTFDEDDNMLRNDTFKHLTINGINACVIPKHIIKNATSLYQNAGSKEILKKDPDGIFLVENDGMKRPTSFH